MIAEIHNKISQSGRNLSDRLEDKLTGDFFGTIRYLPFELGMRHVLSIVRFSDDIAQQSWEQELSNLSGFEGEFDFWPRHPEGEIDLIIRYEQMLIGIEVKYFSGLSSEDEEDEVIEEPEESKNQLARYSNMLSNIGEAKNKYLVFLAPISTVYQVERSLRDRDIFPKDVSLGFLSWEDVLESIKKIDTSSLEIWQETIVNDLIGLLQKKGFLRFAGFDNASNKTLLTTRSYLFTMENSNKNWNWPVNSPIGVNTYDYKK